MMVRMLQLVLGVIAVVLGSSDEQYQVVHPSSGPVRGFQQKSTKGNTFYTFQHIPFALPPIDHLRFKPPKPAGSWDEILDGTVQTPMCIQYDWFGGGVLGEEDCLYLNVFSRKLPDCNDVNPQLPVMVWIHGGAFRVGSGAPELYSPKVLLNKEIVLVTINYRLGPFGFLSTADEIVQGNMGLKDQNMALRWIKDNIAAFGGDPDRITLAGESAGAASVHYHMLSAKSKGLFHRAISQSGSALYPCAYSEPQVVHARSIRLGEILGCPTSDSSELLSCLQDADGHDIAEATTKFEEWHLTPMATFTPTTELAGQDKFMATSPWESIDMGEQADIPWMTGICESEGDFFLAGIWNTDQLKLLNKNYLQVFPAFMDYKKATKYPDEISKQIRNYYFGDKDINQETLDELILMTSDGWINYHIYEPLKKALKSQNKSPLYFYRLTFLGKFSISQLPRPMGGGPSYKPRGPTHADDLIYLFSYPSGNKFEQGSPEELISDQMTALWTNFVATGNPTPADISDLEVMWDPLNLQHFNQYNISLRPSMVTNFFHERMSFWDQIYSNMRESKSPSKDEL